MISEALAQTKRKTLTNRMSKFQEVVSGFRRSREQVSELPLAVEGINCQMCMWQEEEHKPKKYSQLPVMLTAEDDALIQFIRGEK